MKPAALRRSKRQTSKGLNRAKTTDRKNARSAHKTAKAADDERIQRVPIAKIDIGSRYRKDYGDLEELAQSIQEIGLLQPVGITEDFKLVFGGRRLYACRDVLKWKQIAVRIVQVSSIVRGEHDENELRKDFTPSERVAIAKALEAEIGERRGNPSIRQNFVQLDGKTSELVAEKAGFHNRETYRQAKKVVEKGTPKLIEAMDNAKIAISAAAKLAGLPTEKQTDFLDLDGRTLRQAAAKIHSNGHFSATLEKESNVGPGREDALTVIVTDLRDHHNTMEKILIPLCDETRDVHMKVVEKRTLKYLLREIKGLHCDLDRASPTKG